MKNGRNWKGTTDIDEVTYSHLFVAGVSNPSGISPEFSFTVGQGDLISEPVSGTIQLAGTGPIIVETGANFLSIETTLNGIFPVSGGQFSGDFFIERIEAGLRNNHGDQVLLGRDPNDRVLGG